MKSILTLLLLVSFSIMSLAQDVNFTQKNGNINHFNPSLVGAQSNFGVQTNYRNQWPGLSSNPQTFSLLANYRFVGNAGVALELFSDRSSIIQHNHLTANLNYEHTVGEVELRYGVNLGVGQHRIDLSGLRYEDQIDPSQGFVNPTAEPFENNPSNYVLVDLGASVYYKGFMISASNMQVNQPQYNILGSTSRIAPRYVSSLGYLKELKEFSVAGLLTFQQINKTSLLETQVYGQYKFAKLGVGYHQVFGNFSNVDYLSVSAGLQFDKFSVGYSYDDNVLRSSSIQSRGVHQATAAWYIKGLNQEKGMSKLLNTIL